jgi:hypothetical protein
MAGMVSSTGVGARRVNGEVTAVAETRAAPHSEGQRRLNMTAVG